MSNIWRINRVSKDKAKILGEKVNISSFLASILINRGIDTEKKLREYLNPGKTEDFDPFLLPDMEKAVKRIIRAINTKEKIVVFGDYDVDGITATVIMLKNIKALGGVVECYNPDRFAEGYGMKNIDKLEMLYEKGFGLVITVDCGISDGERIAEMKGKLDFVITDHHQPGDILPEAEAVIDAHRADSKYPYEFLCGAAVAYKLCQALWQTVSGDRYNAIGIELAGLATIADVVPLTGENRRIASIGLKRAKNTNIVGLKSLLKVCKLDNKDLSGSDVGYGLAPRLNSTGRLRHARIGIDLLMTNNQEIADRIANEIDELNNERKAIEDSILAEVEESLSNVDTLHSKVIVLSGRDWHSGVIGTLANKLMEKYQRPVFLISFKADGTGVGSARSLDAFHVFKALSAFNTDNPNVLIHFGGHAKAAGLTLLADKIDLFRDYMGKLADKQLGPGDYIKKEEVALEINPVDVELSMVEELSLMDPCGEANRAPLFACRGLDFSEARTTRDGKHLQLIVGNYPHNIKGIGFNLSEETERCQNISVDMTYTFLINEFNGIRSPQFRVESMESPIEEGEHREISIENLRVLYSFLRNIQNSGKQINTSPEILFRELSLVKLGADVEFLSMGIKILREAGLLLEDASGEYYTLGKNLNIPIEKTPTYILATGRTESI